MIAPLIPYGIRGAIWYQGESNVGRAFQYRTLLSTMIRNWREDWREGDFPFYIVQIAPYHYNRSGKDGKPLEPAAWRGDELGCRLLTAKTTANTGLVVTTDIGNLNDIHPKDKQEVKLGPLGLAKTYGRHVAYSGPLYRSMSIEGSEIRLAFDHAHGLSRPTASR